MKIYSVPPPHLLTPIFPSILENKQASFVSLNIISTLITEYPGKLSPCQKTVVKTPNCSRTCEPGYSVSYDKDRHFGSSVFSFKIPGSIQSEIMLNGPVEGTMKVYEDFLTYKTGESTYYYVYTSILATYSHVLGYEPTPCIFSSIELELTCKCGSYRGCT